MVDPSAESLQQLATEVLVNMATEEVELFPPPGQIRPPCLSRVKSQPQPMKDDSHPALGLLQILIGLACGLLGAVATTSILARLLYGVTPIDPLTFAAAALLFTAVGALACYLPARRAAGLDPAATLSAE